MADVYGKWVWPGDVAKPMAEGYGRAIWPGAGESERGGEANNLIIAERIYTLRIPGTIVLVVYL